MLKRFLSLVICFLGTFVICLKGQDVIVEGSSFVLEGKESELKIIGKIRDNLFLSEKTSEGKYFIILQDRSKKEKPIKKVEVELPEDSKVENTDFFSFEIAKDKLYLFTITRDRKNETKEYKGIAYDTLLNISIDWTIMLELSSGKKDGIELLDSYEGISFWDNEQVFVINDSDNGKKVDEKNNITSSIPEYFDLDFSNVEFNKAPIDLSSIGFMLLIDKANKNLLPDYETDDKYKIAVDLEEIDEKELLWISLMSPNEEQGKKSSSQTFYYSMIDGKSEKKINSGKIYKLPENIETKKFRTIYNKGKILISCYYKDLTDKKNILTGIMCLSYNIDSSRIEYVTFNEFSLVLKEFLNSSKKTVKDGLLPHEIIVNKDETISVETAFNTVESESSGNAFSSKVKEKNAYTWGDLLCFSFDATGKLVFESSAKRYAEMESKKRLWPAKNYIVLRGKTDKPVIVITDNINNYADGLLTTKKTENKFDETTCIAVVNWNGEQRVLIQSVEKEFGVSLYPDGIYPLKDNEYIWFGYKDGVGKIVTIKLD